MKPISKNIVDLWLEHAPLARARLRIMTGVNDSFDLGDMPEEETARATAAADNAPVREAPYLQGLNAEQRAAATATPNKWNRREPALI